MRRLLIFAMLAGVAIPAGAAHRVSVEQLRQWLSARHASARSDGATAQQVGDLALTEQLSGQSLDQMLADLRLGPNTVLALYMLADSSAFLAPPQAQLPPRANPDIVEQRKMLSAAIEFEAVTLHRLPDFLATRVTRSFDDNPLIELNATRFAPRAIMHLASSWSKDVTYRNGLEVATEERNPGHEQQHAGLSTSGEFGPVLATILTDAANGKITWSRWEQTPDGVAGVFHYQVPKDISHYKVIFCCKQNLTNRAHQMHAGDPTGMQPVIPEERAPAYQGDLYIDPVTGAIARFTLEAETSPADPLERAAISVEYGKVDIGGNTYICPVRSIALSVDRSRQLINPMNNEFTRINEVTFDGYRRFGSDVHVVAEGPVSASPAN